MSDGTVLDIACKQIVLNDESHLFLAKSLSLAIMVNFASLTHPLKDSFPRFPKLICFASVGMHQTSEILPKAEASAREV